MPKKLKRIESEETPTDLWVAPKYSLKGPAGERAWDTRIGGPPSNSRYLELADIALGIKQPARLEKRKRQSKQSGKTEAYSS
jgi:hypothetical protein